MSNNEELQELITLQEASKLLKCHKNTLRLWHKKGILTAVRIGQRGLRYRKEDIRQLLKNGNSVMANEVTRKVEKIKKVAQEWERLHNLFMHAPAFISALRGNNHVFEFANKQYYQLVGHREIIGKPIGEAIPEAVEQGFIKLLDSVYTTGKPFLGKEMQITIQKEKGGTLEDVFVNFVYQPIVESDGSVSGIFVHGVDITDLVKARQNIKESQERLQFMSDAMPQQVWTATPEGALDYVNQYAVDYFAKGSEVIVGEGWQQVVHPEDLPGVIKSWTESLQTGKPYQVFFRLRKHDNSYRWHLGRALPQMKGDKIVKWYGTNTDVDDQKKLENQREDFMGIVSHELKTPVTSIKAFTQILQKKFAQEGNEKATVLLGKMDSQITKLTVLIGDLLDVTKIQGGKLQFHESFFSFDELADEIVEEIQRTTNKQIIERQGTTGKTVFGDRDRIGQVMINMLTNAIKYSPHSNKVVVKAILGKNDVKLCVQDFGIGMSKEKSQHVFERFYRASGDIEQTIPGIGLGMYISAEIIQRQKGRIWVESKLGKGSTFCFCLPMHKSKSTKKLSK